MGRGECRTGERRREVDKEGDKGIEVGNTRWTTRCR